MSAMIGKQVMVAAIIAWVTGIGHASVTMVDGTPFSQTIEIPHTRLHLKGAAVLRYLGFIKAYAGALYLPKDSDAPQVFDDIPKHLVLDYRVGISAEHFSQATLSRIKESVSRDVFQGLLPKIEQLNRLYRRVEPGDRYGLTYIPGVGTQLIYNTTPLGTIEGLVFSQAVFAIWLGDNPIDKGFRDKLLGKLR